MRNEESPYHLSMLKNIVDIHYGFTKSSQCINSILGSHDQAGNRKNRWEAWRLFCFSLWWERQLAYKGSMPHVVAAANKLRLEEPALTDEYTPPEFIHEDSHNRVLGQS
ncbi:hypothetical protein EMWEY_00036850 [Eimeria maxima]|uniref:Uncharacterized protein n=1 Tax=Eimeria maxima TaxID=5804 RepID=U6MH61_EIMMA|nr:hypothetical protein EMWEY_00036850 [Eimeria maxima]CDJ60985.1 hypothetical protein EMWEY_00036850 [Eimeria maxima]